MLFKTFLLFYGSIFYGGSQSNSLQFFSAKNTQSDLKKNLFLWSKHLAEQEKRKMMNLFWNFIQNGLRGINAKTYNLNHNRIVRERTQQVVKWSLFFIQPFLYYLSRLEAIAIVANVAQILVDVGLRQLYNSINNKQRIIFGFQREGNFAFFDVKS